ncbi:MAG: TetR/AcrR family transcriptional regulator, partial [Desulfocucumaceae bacterium]
NSRKNQVISNIIREAIDNNEFKNVDLEAAINIFMSIFDGISLQWMTHRHRDKQLLERTVKTAIEIYFEGVIKP